MPAPLAIATCDPMPEPDHDQEPLLEALRARGVEADVVPWDAPYADWGAYRAVVLRSTWDYTLQPERFLAWVRDVAAKTALHNPAELVAWNAHKVYLLELAGRGVPVVPTVLLRRGSQGTLAEVLDAQGWDRVVIKPAVSAGSRATLRVGRDRLADGEAHLCALVAREDALIQGYVSSVEEHGERSLIFIAGELTHAIRKNPRFQDDAEGVSGPMPISDAERALAEGLMAKVAPDVLYGRVDMALGADDRPMIMELEVIEPSLFLDKCPAALERLVEALARLVRHD